MSRALSLPTSLAALALLVACQPSDTGLPEFVLNGSELISLDEVPVGMPVDVDGDFSANDAQDVLAESCAGPSGLAAEIASEINAVREAQGKTTLGISAKLDRVAKSHGCDVARTGRATVVGSNGSSVVDRARAAGYPTCGVIQLVGAGGSAASVVSAWMRSAPHREQLLGQLSDEIGAGVATSASGRVWWSVVIGDNCR